MKPKVAIVNDCGYYMQDILPILKEEFDVVFIKRTRGFVNKTAGLMWRIRAAKADLFHVNYALQDAWLVRKLKHLDLLLCHGSDVRTTIHSRKWGWIVRGNLKRAKKVGYSTDDIAETVHDYCPEAEYMPVPVKTDVFTPADDKPEKVRAVYFIKWYEPIPQEMIALCRKHGIEVDIMKPALDYEEMPDFLRRYQIYIDRSAIKSHSKTALEAMSCGLAVTHFTDSSTVDGVLCRLSDPECCQQMGKGNRDWVKQHHDSHIIAANIIRAWKELL